MKLWQVFLVGSVTLPQIAGPVTAPARHQGGSRTLAIRGTQATATSGGTTGTLVTIRPRASYTAIILRTKKDHLLSLHLTNASHLSSRDGYRIAADQLRLADRMMIGRDGRIQDISQHMVVLTGIVSSPGSDGGSTIIVIKGAKSMIVDLIAATRYRDPTRETFSVGQIEEADVVHLRGMVDDPVGEMTRTAEVTRLGPTRCKGTTPCKGEVKL